MTRIPATCWALMILGVTQAAAWGIGRFEAMRQPDWQSDCGTVTLYLGDCLEVLPTLPVGSVEAVVTDPPYNVGFQYVGDDSGDDKKDYVIWCAAWLYQLRRISTGAVAISVGQANLGRWSAMSQPSWWLAWWKPAAMGRCVVGFNNWEPIALYGKPKKQVCDVIRATIKPDPGLEGHPCPKPLEWGVRQVEMLTYEGDAVLDCFAGSGTTGIACINTGRKFIGIEKEPAYFAIAVERCKKALAEREQPKQTSLLGTTLVA